MVEKTDLYVLEAQGEFFFCFSYFKKLFSHTNFHDTFCLFELTELAAFPLYNNKC